MNTAAQPIDFYREDDLVTVQFHDEDIEVKLPDFKKYLERNNRLEWGYDYTSPAGNIENATGTYSMDEYFEGTEHQEILADLDRYLKTKR